MLELRKGIFNEAYITFTEQAQTELKKLKLSPPAHFQAPPYRFDQGREEWMQSFIASLLSQIKASSALKQQISDDLLYDMRTYSHGSRDEDLYSKIPYLDVLTPDMARPYQKSNSTTGAVTERSLRLPNSYPAPLTLDTTALRQYLEQRFPLSLQDFLVHHDVQLVLDDGRCDEAYALQIEQGYPTGYKFMSALDAPDTQYYLLQSSKGDSYRFLSCEMYGEWDQKRILSLLGPIFFQGHPQGHAKLFKHSGAKELFNFIDTSAPLIRQDHFNHDDARMEDLRQLTDWRSLTPKSDSDLVIMGYMNSVWEYISNSPESKMWQRTSLVWSGIDVALFLKRGPQNEIQRVIISVENVYGDEMDLALSAFWAKGFRKFIYLGSTGGLKAGLSPGDILVPSRFQNFDVKTFTDLHAAAGAFYEPGPENQVSLPNAALKWKFADIQKDGKSHVWKETTQGNVPTLMVETIPYMTSENHNHAVDAIDVETYFYAQFFKNRGSPTETPAENSVALIVTDLPLVKGKDYSEHAAGNLSAANVGHMIDEILGLGPSTATTSANPNARRRTHANWNPPAPRKPVSETTRGVASPPSP